MKEMRIEVPNTQKEVVQKLILSHKLDFSETALIDEKHLYIVRVNERHTNNLLHELRSRGVGEIFGHVSIIQLNLFLSSDKDISDVVSSPAANVEEIIANIEESAVLSGSYLALVILSAALAAFGLLANSVVIIIGSMIVAPLLGPVALTSLGVLVPGRGLLKNGLIAESVGLISTIAIAFFVGLILRIEESDVTLEMLERASDTNPINNIIFAILSGLAAGLIISKGQSLSMVGVAIAASLAPPAANIGLFLSLNDYTNANFAALLLILNILAINASCSIMFTLFRLPSKAGVSKRRAIKTSRNMKILILSVIVAFLILSYYYLTQLDFIT